MSQQLSGIVTGEAQEEWLAWQAVCTQLRNVSVEINDQPDLHVALLYWAECLSQLRGTQTQDACDRMHRTAAFNYEERFGTTVS